jgi:hypothetical protein
MRTAQDERCKESKMEGEGEKRGGLITRKLCEVEM